jgi:hypothetical protein
MYPADAALCVSVGVNTCVHTYRMVGSGEDPMNIYYKIRYIWLIWCMS